MAEEVQQLKELRKRMEETMRVLDLPLLRAKRDQKTAEMNDPSFWAKADRAKAVSQEREEVNAEIESWESLQHETAETLEWAQLIETENDEAGLRDLQKKIALLQSEFERLELRVLFHGEHDARHAIVAIHAGAGGVDAQDWAEMLLRMLLRFCERQRFRVQILEEARGQEAGMKRVVFEVQGRHAYGMLRSEHGVHRLVRISPYDAEKMRHTSFALIEVVPDLGDVEDILIKPEEIRVDTFRASGHGGQGVNTTDSAVRITHLSTGIVVSCQNERSQTQNRATAMKILKSKVYQYEHAKKEEERKKIRGELSSAEWGSQIRSYVLHPYKLVKDHRTEVETSNVDQVLDGDLLMFMEGFLKNEAKEQHRD